MKAILTAAVLAAGLAGAGQAATIVNGSFEQASVSPGNFTTLGAGSTAITGWTVLPSTIDYIGTYWTASDGNRSLDLNGNGQGGIMTQITNMIAGRSYNVYFDLSGNPAGQPPEKLVQVNVYGSTQLASQDYTYNTATNGTTLSNMKWVTEVLTFTADSTSAFLHFLSKTGAQNNAYGAALDNVRIELAPVPLPAAGLLMLAGLAGLAAVRRRKAA